jgi:3',5'-cyclic AMP phosphodiesterase CpdA
MGEANRSRRGSGDVVAPFPDVGTDMVTNNKTKGVRLAHLSDVHITSARLEWQVQDYMNKRFAGWINHRWLGRRFRFRHSEWVLRSLSADLRERQPDHVIFSGDATALGFESELRLASELMGVGDPGLPPGLAVPGNHDYATRSAEASGLFERVFATWQHGERVDDAIYPFAQRVGDYCLIGVNSSTGNRWAWDASGRVGPQQIDRLRELLDRLDDAPRILVTHYPVCKASGRRETPWRRLRDLKRLVGVAIDGGVGLWVHGHRHRGYQLPTSRHAPFPLVCAGSATQTRIWSYCEYTLEGTRCRGARRIFDPLSGRFFERDTFEVTMRPSHMAHSQLVS